MRSVTVDCCMGLNLLSCTATWLGVRVGVGVGIVGVGVRVGVGVEIEIEIGVGVGFKSCTATSPYRRPLSAARGTPTTKRPHAEPRATWLGLGFGFGLGLGLAPPPSLVREGRSAACGQRRAGHGGQAALGGPRWAGLGLGRLADLVAQVELGVGIDGVV